MYTDLRQWIWIRKQILEQGVSRRQIAREIPIDRKTVAKIARHPAPLGYRRSKPYWRPAIRPHVHEIQALLRQNEALPKRDRLNVMDMYLKLKADCGYAGSYSALRDYVRQHSGPPVPPVDVWGDVYEMLTKLPKRDAIALLDLLSKSDKPVVSERKAKELISKCGGLFEARLSRKHEHQKLKEEATVKWIHDVLQKSKSQDEIKQDIGAIPDFEKLLDQVYTGGLKKRNKAMSVLASAHGMSARTICKILNISRGAARRYLKDFEVGGVKQMNVRQCKVPTKSNNECIRKAVLATLHEPPSAYGINRTSWKCDDLLSVLTTKGTKISRSVLAEIVKKEGFKWKTARVVLTSKDPEYREKLTNIQDILGALKDDEAFFSIDEYGPFSIKMKGGRKLVAPGEHFTIPQWQKSRGKLIMTAALELSSNQVTHFYSEKKNTDEMIKMADLLVDRYRDCSKIWLSWDAASWHISKKLNEHIESINEKAALNGGPALATAPLPAGAQFLNVIESVFSGLARNVIHHSDYRSADEAKQAIDKYFESRNSHFLHNPKRAGKKIWGKERVISRFDDANNCKDPRYR